MPVRTVVFTDIVGSTGLLEVVGDLRWASMLERIDELVAATLRGTGGSVENSTGDGHLLLFDQAASALRFAVAFQDAMGQEELFEVPIPIRIGVHFGDVIERAGELRGRTVHAAARIGALAGAGEVLCSAAVRDAATDHVDYTFGPLQTTALRGLDGLYDIVSLRWGASSRAASAPTEVQLLDRARERRWIDDLLEHALSRRGAAGLIEAPAGIGKSALLRLAERRAESAGLKILQARGDELEMDYPFGLVAQLLDQAVLDDPDELLAGEARFAAPVLGIGEANAGGTDGHRERRALLAVCLRLAQRNPLVVIVDDAHWSDLPSLRWLAQLTRRVSGEALSVLIAARPSQPGEYGELLGRIASQPGLDSLEPRPLSIDAVRMLVEQQLGVPDDVFLQACLGATGGNPFLVSELIRSLLDEGIDPVGVAADDVLVRHRAGLARVVLARLAAVGPAARAMATATAIFPTDTPLRHAAALAELDLASAGEAADALAAAGVLAPGRPLRFVHPLTRQAIYDELAPSRRSALHQIAFAALVHDGAASHDLAAHAMLIEPNGQVVVVGALVEGARHARGIGAPDIAARYLARALAEPPPADDERQQIRLELGDLYMTLADYELAIETVRPALSSDDPRVRLGAVDTMCESYGFGLHRWADAGHQVELELLRRSDMASDDHLHLEYMRWFYSYIGSDEPLGHAGLAEVASRIHGPGRGAAEVLELLAFLQIAAGTATVESVLKAFRTVHEYAPDAVPPELLNNAERPDLALPLLQEARAKAEAEGNVVQLALCLRRLGETYWLYGDLPRAEDHVRQAFELTDGRNAISMLMLVRLRLERGDVAGATALLDERGLLGPPDEVARAFGHAPSKSALWFLRGKIALARDALDLAEREFRRADADSRWVLEPESSRLCDALLRQGRREEALAHAELLVEPARVFGAPSRLGLAAALRARCLPDVHEAIAELESNALDLLSRGPNRMAEAEGLLIYGEALRRALRRTDARPVLAKARELALASGAELLVGRIEAEQRLAGAKPRRTAVTGPDALTASEVRVAELAAAGRTNAEIGGELVISIRTVEMHLGRTYRKLGIEGRSGLADAMSGKTTVAAPVSAGIDPAQSHSRNR
jgi:class 3 adenylate cyclase/DNA-binding CsgD family transcriptional regulator